MIGCTTRARRSCSEDEEEEMKSTFQRFLEMAQTEGFRTDQAVPVWDDAVRVSFEVAPETVLEVLKKRQYFGNPWTRACRVTFKCACGVELSVELDGINFNRSSVGCEVCRMIYDVSTPQVKAKVNFCRDEEAFVRGVEQGRKR
jgi:hypothetical protein